MKKIVSLLQGWAKILLRIARSGSYYGTGRGCPVCGRSSRKFSSYGRVPREDAMCLYCGALERHRLVWLYFSRKTNLFDGKPKKMLHIAPEKCFEQRLIKRLGEGYLTADLVDPDVMVRMDICDIEYADETFDVIYCSHVLEHVLDDRCAMRQFHRVMKKDGWAILLVPISGEITFEDSTIVAPCERLRAFEHEDHVRRYGADYIDRLREAGFNVAVSRASDLFTKDEIIRMGLTPACGEIYYCTKA
jgi:SAM-dependent methyltransferase